MALAFYVDRWVLRERLVNEWANPRAMRGKLANDLKLDATQRVRLDSILDARNRRFEELMAPMRPVLDSVSVNARKQIRDLLTPEQQTVYDQLQREREEARRQEKRQ
jgi:hypothetical protein